VCSTDPAVFVSRNNFLGVYTGYLDLPKSPTGVKAVVINHAAKVRSFVLSELRLRLKEGKRFSLTFDEWTSVRNRRYMIINVHDDGPQFWSLGLLRVHGSMPAETCVDLIRKKLDEFGLDLDKDIVAVCSDGASVMCKVGKLLSAEHQLCLDYVAVLSSERNHYISLKPDRLCQSPSQCSLPYDPPSPRNVSTSACSSVTVSLHVLLSVSLYFSAESSYVYLYIADLHQT